MKKTLLSTFLVGIILSASILLGLVPVSLFFLKGSVSEAVEKAIGLELEISGPLRLVLGFNSRLSASGINVLPATEQEDALLSIEHLTISFDLRDLLRGDIHVRSLVAEDLAINYCPGTPAERKTLDETPSTASAFDPTAQQPLITLDELHLERVRLFCKQPGKRVEYLPDFFDLHGSAVRGQAMRLEIETAFEDERVYLSASGGSLQQLLSDSKEFLLEVELSAYQATAHAKVEVQNLFTEPSFKAALVIDSVNPAKLFDITGLDGISEEALYISAEIIFQQEELQLQRLDGKLGEFQLGLSGLWQTNENRPWLEVQAHIPTLDLDLFSASTTGNTSGSQQAQDWKEINLKPWFEPMENIDARLKLTIDQIDHAPFTLHELSLEMGLKQGRLTVDQAAMRLENTQVGVTATLDTQTPCPELNSTILINDVDLELFRRVLEREESFGGILGRVQVDTVSCGETPGQHLDGFQAIGHLANASVWYEEPTNIALLDSLDIEFSWRKRGWLSLDAHFLGEPFQAEISFASVEEILSQQSWPLEFTAKSGGNRVFLKADTAFSNDQLDIKGQLDLSISRFGSLHQWIGSRPENALSGELHSKFVYGQEGLQLSTLEMRLGRSNLAGKFQHTLSQQGSELSIELKSEYLDIEELSNLFPELQSADGYIPDKVTEEPDSSFTPDNPADSDWLARWLDLPSFVFDVSVDTIQTTAVEIEGFKLSGQIHEHHIKDGSMNLSIGTLGISGAVDADLRSKPWKLAYRIDVDNADIGGMLSRMDLAQDVSAHAEHLAMQLATEGQTVQELATNARLQAQVENFTWLSHLTMAEQDAKELYLEQLELIAVPGKNTSWQARGTLNDVPVRFWMLSPSIQETLTRKKGLPLSLVVGAGDDVLMVDALLDMASGQEVRATLEISGEGFDTDEEDLSQLHSPLSDYQLKTRAVFRPGVMIFSELQASTGSSELSGQVKVSNKENHYHIEIELDSPRIETGDFVRFAADWRSASEDETETTVVQTGDSEEEEDLIKIVNREAEKLIDRYSVDASVHIEELWSAGTLLGTTTVGLVTNGEETILDPFQIALPGGNMSARYHSWTNADGVNISLNLSTERLEYAGLARLLDPNSEAGGWLYLDTDLRASAPDYDQLLPALEGTINLAVFPDDIEAGFLDLWASNLIIALLPTGDSGKKLNCMVARFEVKEGIMKSTNAFLDSTDIIVRGRGDIDLANRQLNLLFAPQAKLERFLSISTPIKVTGSLNDFQIGVVPGGFLNTMVRWYYGLIYVPWKWVTGERFPPDGIETCYNAMRWDFPIQTE